MSPTAMARVLVVDDRSENLIALEAILQGLPVTPVSVSSGEAALKQLLEDDFAVILLDAQMPGMDGFEAATAIKARKRTQHVPIIFLTAADRDAHLAFRGYAAGAVDYITKPFDPWVLRAKVSVFVELWSKNDQLREAAEASARRDAEYAAMLAAGQDALDTLAGVANCDEVDKLRAAVADANEALRRALL